MHLCTSLQTDNHASTPPLSFFTGQMPFLLLNQQHQSTEGTWHVIKHILKTLAKVFLRWSVTNIAGKIFIMNIASNNIYQVISKLFTICIWKKTWHYTTQASGTEKQCSRPHSVGRLPPQQHALDMSDLAEDVQWCIHGPCRSSVAQNLPSNMQLL